MDEEIQIPEGSKDLCWLVNERERERENFVESSEVNWM